MTLCRPSATLLSISTPRLIGPGCMIRQSGFKSFARCFVRPKNRVYSPVPRKYSLRLRWMFVRAIAGIDHARFEPLRKKLRSARGAVTQHKNIGMQRLEIARRVLKRFALRQTGYARRDIDHIRA